LSVPPDFCGSPDAAAEQAISTPMVAASSAVSSVAALCDESGSVDVHVDCEPCGRSSVGTPETGVHPASRARRVTRQPSIPERSLRSAAEALSREHFPQQPAASPFLLTVLRRLTPTLNERRVMPLTAYPVTALHTGTDPRACAQCWRRRSSENASSGLGCSLGCCSRLLRHRDHVCRASLVQIRRARTVPPRERRMPAAARQLKHDRRLAARLAPASSTTSRARADGASAPRVCASLRTATLRSLRLPAPRGAGLYYGRRPEGPGSNHATITASLSRFPLTPL
jgi:hypothetical protein